MSPDPLVRVIAPSDLLDEKYDLHVWWGSQKGMEHMCAFRESERHKFDPNHQTTEADVRTDVWWAYWQSQVCLDGMPILIRPDMVDLIEHAAQTMPTQPLREDDAPAPTGFMFLARPVILIDINGRSYPIRAVTWGPAKIDKGSDVLKEGYATWLYISRNDLGPSDPLFPYVQQERKDGVWFPDLDLLGHHTFEFGVDNIADRVTLAEEDAVRPHADVALKSSQSFNRFVLAAWTIMQQRIATVERVKPARSHARRWTRRNLTPPTITVVDLRRASSAGTQEHGVVNWTHRWFVNGHWRRITHPRTGVQRAVWVSPHIKGPEDKPLFYTERIYNFKR